MKTKRLNKGNYEIKTTMIIDNTPKNVICNISYCDENKQWYVAIDGISENTMYSSDTFYSKAQAIRAIETMKTWKHYKGLGYCLVD